MDRVKQADTRIGLLHHVGGGNLGDDATLESVADGIRQRWSQAEIVAFSMNPDDTETRHGIKSYPIRRNCWSIGYKSAAADGTFKAGVKALTRKHRHLFWLLKSAKAVICLPSETFRELSFLASSRHTMKSFDLLIISGGGQLTEKDGPWGFPYTILKWVVLARSAGVRCVFLNVGAGPLTQPLSKFFVRRALLAADYVSLRDNKSQALVQKIGFTGESRVCPDSAYGLEVAAVRGSARETGSQSIVGFAPMDYCDPAPGGYQAEKDQIVYDAFIRKLASFASWLISRSHALALFGTDFGVDPKAIQDLQSALLSYHGISSRQCGVDHSVKSVRDLLAAMSGMDYVVTCRFHGVVFAHLLKKPVLAIAPHPKVAELMADLELSNYCVDARDFDASALADKFASMVANAEEIKARMAMSLTRNRQQLRNQFDGLFRNSLNVST
jgi:polysaccharide pyruvyl transferase WcaK-like protein